jgi:hypothetical protein
MGRTYCGNSSGSFMMPRLPWHIVAKMLKKLSREHLQLTSYSRMRVNLAAEVSEATTLTIAPV